MLDVAVEQKDAKQPPPPLTRDNFTVLDNGTPRKLRTFEALTAAQQPERVILVVDQLNIELRGLDNEQGQVVDFLRNHAGPLPVPTAVAVLTDHGVQMEPVFTTNSAAMAAALQKVGVSLRALTRDSGFYGAQERFDGSLKALELLVSHETGQPGRTAIFWVSPGWPLLSGPDVQLSASQQRNIFSTVVSLSDAMRAAHVTLYAINPVGAVESVGHEFYYEQYVKGIAKPRDAELADLGLQVLAMQSGGRVLNSNDTGALLEKSYADLKSYYQLSFDMPSDAPPNQYHSLSVKIDRGGLTALTRQGYYTAP